MRKQIMLTLGDHNLDISLSFEVRPKESKVLV